MIIDSPVVKKEKIVSKKVKIEPLPIQPKNVRLVKAEEIVGEDLWFIPTHREEDGTPLCGNICRRRDGIKMGEWSDIKDSKNYVVINDKRVNI